MKKFDIIGLGAIGVDYIAKVNGYARINDKVISNDVATYDGGVTANNVYQASVLGMDAGFCGTVGDDIHGSMLIDTLRKNNIKAVINRSGKTQFCWVIVNKSGDKQIYAFPNCIAEVTPEIVENRFSDAIRSCKHFHTEIAMIPFNAALKGAEIAKQTGAKVFVDIDGNVDEYLNDGGLGTKDRVFELIRISDIIKISENAIKSISGVDNIEESIKKLLPESEIVVVTVGDKGCYIGDKNEIIYCPGYKIKAVDTTGAGDAFMAGLSYAILSGMRLKEIGMFANACGAYNAMHLGARSSGTLEEIREFIKHN